MDQREYYDCKPGSNCQTEGRPLPVDSLQDKITGCEDCASIHSAMKIRTEYDQFWIKFYNNKAQNFQTDLLSLQFQR